MNSRTNTAATIPSYQDIAQATFGTLWPEATPQDWALVVHKLREALQAGSNGPSEGAAPLEYEPQPCCGQYDTCQRVCTPRGIEIGMRKARAESKAGAERDPNDPDPVEHARELAVALIEARKELVEIRPEAARYRWLRERPFGADFEHSSIEKGAGWALIFCMPEGSTISANLDKSLDEAMASSNATPET